MSSPFSLGSPEFYATSQLQQYCNNGRNLIRPLANELRIAAEELQAALREVPAVRGGVLLAPIERRRLARQTSKHLVVAAEGVEMACSGLVRTYLSFQRNYVNVTPERSKRAFDLDG
ncbi:MAG TPA: hypothetical protein VM490_16610 [Armatimonadaceae bacterium]|jgi:hypothetical protein|nr:hypothetical protein [Armatimonadaceae bacterium]